MKRIGFIFLLFIILMAGVLCTSQYRVTSNDNKGGTSDIKNNEEVRLIIYYPDKSLSKLVAEERTARFKKSLEATIVRELLRGSQNGSPFGFPKGTKVLDVSRKEDLVKVNLSRDFIKNFSGNENVELMTVYSLVNSLTEIPGVKRVEIRVQGKGREFLNKRVSIREPLERNRNLLQKNGGKGPREVLEKQLNLEREGRWLEAYQLYSDEANNPDRKYYHEYAKEMEEVSYLGFTSQKFDVKEASLADAGDRAKVKVSFYPDGIDRADGTGQDFYFNCVRINEIWMVDWLTAQ